ncbi:MAG TPA: ABC transporter permease [Acidimicrobiales bacterium]|jgi:ABC-2 type transport system permease protein|nr:ABC transporter permease [Acidimicrobiales bacterium]
MEARRPRPPARPQVRAREAGFLRDLASVAGRALRQIPREPESIVPAVIVPTFFYTVNLGSLQKVAQAQTGVDYKAFLLPLSIVFAVTGVSRASALVTDIRGGYFDRLCMSPVSRLSLLLGLMVADFALVMALTVPVLVLGFAVGVRFATGPLGVLVFVLVAASWGLVYTGFPYAIALKTGNPAAVNTSFVLFFPFAFLTDGFVPKAALTGWLSAIATYNPVTYLLGGLRSILMSGWAALPLAKALAAVAGIGVVSISLSLLALRGRINRGA